MKQFLHVEDFPVGGYPQPLALTLSWALWSAGLSWLVVATESLSLTWSCSTLMWWQLACSRVQPSRQEDSRLQLVRPASTISYLSCCNSSFFKLIYKSSEIGDKMNWLYFWLLGWLTLNLTAFHHSTFNWCLTEASCWEFWLFSVFGLEKSFIEFIFH